MTIERLEFQRLLFRTAFCVMACDGEIEEREVNEIKKMNESSAYFQGIDLAGELEELLLDLKATGKKIVDDLFKLLAEVEISTVQELLILEVALRLVYADAKIDENEIKFIRFLRSKLNLHDEIIRDRFGAVEFLYDKDYFQDVIKQEVHDELFASITIPDISELSKVDFSMVVKK